MKVSAKIVGRLSLYRRILTTVQGQGIRNLYSHELASLAGVTAAQVRRDIMNIGYSGNPNRGYDVDELARAIELFLDDPRGQKAALVGVGNLGRAILAYFSGRRPKLSIEAAFDIDPQKYGRVIKGCRCYSLEEMGEVINRDKITIGIVTVPASGAQIVTDMLVNHGVTGVLNFAPVPIRVPTGIYVEDIDMTMSLEKVAYFARIHN